MLLLAFFVRTVVVALITEGLLLLFRKRSAAFRSVIVNAGIVSLLGICLVGYGTKDTPIAQVTTKMPAVTLILREKAQAQSLAPVVQTPSSFDPSTVLQFVWILGGLLVALRLVLSLASLGLRVGQRVKVEREFGVNVFEDPTATVPVTTWWGSGMILLPSGWQEWPEERLQSVLSHERSHLERGDWWLQLLANLVCVFVWPNPFAWWMKRQAQELAEEAVDDRVVLTGISAIRYAHDLLQIAVQRGRSIDSLSLPMVIKPQVSRRIEMVLNPKKHRGAASLVAIVGTSGLYALFTACASMWGLVERPKEIQPKKDPIQFLIYLTQYQVDANPKLIQKYDPTAFKDNPNEAVTFKTASAGEAKQLAATLHGKIVNSPILRTLDGLPAEIFCSQPDGKTWKEKVTVTSGATYQASMELSQGVTAEAPVQMKDVVYHSKVKVKSTEQDFLKNAYCVIWSGPGSKQTLSVFTFKIANP